MRKIILIPLFFFFLQTVELFANEPTVEQFNELTNKVEILENEIDFWKKFGLPIGGVTLIGFFWTIWLFFKGIGKKLDEELKSAETKAKIDILLNEAILRKEEQERQAILTLKGKPIHIVFKDSSIDQKEIWSYLNDKCKFTHLIPHLTQDDFDVKPNELVLFYRHKADYLTEDEIIKIGTRLEKKAKYFYFNTDNTWWTRPEVNMSNRANSFPTLEENLLKTLKS